MLLGDEPGHSLPPRRQFPVACRTSPLVRGISRCGARGVALRRADDKGRLRARSRRRLSERDFGENGARLVDLRGSGANPDRRFWSLPRETSNPDWARGQTHRQWIASLMKDARELTRTFAECRPPHSYAASRRGGPTMGQSRLVPRANVGCFLLMRAGATLSDMYRRIRDSSCRACSCTVDRSGHPFAGRPRVILAPDGCGVHPHGDRLWAPTLATKSAAEASSHVKGGGPMRGTSPNTAVSMVLALADQAVLSDGGSGHWDWATSLPPQRAMADDAADADAEGPGGDGCVRARLGRAK